MRRYKLTFIGFFIALFIWGFATITDADFFESFLDFLKDFEQFEFDELIIPAMVFFAFLLFNLAQRERSRNAEVEKSKIYRAMLSSTHHILNNFLNQMTLFKMTADQTPGFDPEILVLYDRVMRNASSQIDALGDIANISEASIYKSINPDYGSNAQKKAEG